MGESADVRVSPLFDEPAEMQDYFDSKGYEDDYTRMIVFNQFIILKFVSRACAADFVKRFDGAIVNNTQIYASIIDGPKPTAPSASQPQPTHTVSFQNLETLSDRFLWTLTNDIGFVRQIECKGSTGFVQFDTEDDAARCIAHFKNHRSYKVEGVTDFVLNKPRMGIPLTPAEPQVADIPLRSDSRSSKKKKDKKRRPRPSGEEFLPPWERERVRGYEN